jgi:hypothetical protein
MSSFKEVLTTLLVLITEVLNHIQLTSDMILTDFDRPQSPNQAMLPLQQRHGAAHAFVISPLPPTALFLGCKYFLLPTFIGMEGDERKRLIRSIT